MSKLVLLRHGQASFGAVDYDQLSPLGIEQAKVTGTYFRERAIRFDRLVSGPLLRQRQTLSHLIDGWPEAAAPEIEPALKEFADGQQILAAAVANFGPPQRGDPERMRSAQIQAYIDIIGEWVAGRTTIEGVVACRQFRRGIREWMETFVSSHASDKRQLLVTSAGVISVLVCEILGLPDNDMLRFMRVVKNCSITEITISETGFNLLTFNSTAHMPASLSSAI